VKGRPDPRSLAIEDRPTAEESARRAA
jgi:hypothetical protein